MSGDDQHWPESDGGQDHDGSQAGGSGDDYGGGPRPDAMVPFLDEGQLVALRTVGREWDKVSAGPQVWRDALPVDPAVGAYAEEDEFRTGRFIRVVSVAGQDGQARPIETPSVSEIPSDAAGTSRRCTAARGRGTAAGRKRARGGTDAQARRAAGPVS